MVNTTIAVDRLRQSSNDRLRQSSREVLGGGASMFRAAGQATVAVADAEKASRPQTSEQVRGRGRRWQVRGMILVRILTRTRTRTLALTLTLT